VPAPAVVATLLREPVRAVVALGANLGDAAASLRQALVDIAALPHTELLKTSPLLQSAPLDAEGPTYINAVAQIATRFNAVELLQALQALENAAGRTRAFVHAPRTLDLDVLFYGEAQMQSDYLNLPHPRWTQRAFVLWPLQTVCPDKVTPEMLAAVAHQACQWLPA
jgi:2-amino-4-hydroxy-6-hydroxymethyldihydropteridine diphosphokinase